MSSTSHPQILHHNLVLICFLLHQGQAPTWCLRWWVGEWLSAALRGGAVLCQGDTQKKKKRGQEGLPPNLHTQATICSETLPVGHSTSSSQPPMELSVHLPQLLLTCYLLWKVSAVYSCSAMFRIHAFCSFPSNCIIKFVLWIAWNASSTPAT